ncbi:MAG: hypothetical protein V1862_01200 [Methanobacteriota archaeon]
MMNKQVDFDSSNKGGVVTTWEGEKGITYESIEESHLLQMGC